MSASLREAVDRLPPLRETIARHRLGARRSLGQHFLLDLNLTGRIARAAGPIAEGTVIEIGPGPGGLTRSLLREGAGQVIAVERDLRAVAALTELASVAGGRLQVIEGDARSLAVHALGAPPRRIVANLPYNIATALLTGWLHHATAFAGLTLMFQREVAERLTASVGTPQYGRLSVLTQWLCRAEILFDLPARAFTPAPKVTSSIVRLTPRPAPLAPADRAVLELVTRHAFGQRRKMLRRSLAGLGGATLLSSLGLDPGARAESLPVEAFCAIARAVAQQKSENQ